jgi:hypothetical protein
MKTHTPEMGTWEFPRTLELSENDWRGQNTLHWRVLYIIGKLLKCRCLKWARMTHLDICNISYGKKSGIDLTPVCASGVRHTVGNLSTRVTTLLQTWSWSKVWAKNYSPIINVGFNNMRVSIVHHKSDVEFCTCGCEVVCANPRHGLTIGPTMPCQVAKHMYQTNFNLWSNLLCPKEIG